MTVSRKFLFLFFLVLYSIIWSVFVRESQAVPAAPVEHTLTQGDGAQFRARQWGDEWLQGWETTDGYAVVFDEPSNYWKYAQKNAKGGLEASSLIVGKDSPGKIPKKLRPTGEELKENMLKRKAPVLQGPSGVSAYSEMPDGPSGLPFQGPPLAGTNKIPVILINFNDTTTTYTVTNFNTRLFGTGINSLSDYYKEISYNALSVSAGTGGIQNWRTAGNTHNYYGQSCGSPLRTDCWPAKLVEAAVAAVDSTFNFAEYDQDNDCYVDAVAVVHQGKGQETSGNANDIWSHRWDLYSANYWYGDSNGVYITNDSSSCGLILINDYIMIPETQDGIFCNSGSTCQSTIGVFAHEYGHAIGLPDLYDTDATSEGIGNYGLMAGGSWLKASGGDYGDRPSHMSAWSKAVLGWVSPQPVLGTISDSVSAASGNADVYQVRSGSPGNWGEYFLIENRQKSGFDIGLPDSGLAIWHIDESMGSFFNNDVNKTECVPVGPSWNNCSSSHYRVSLVQADNQHHLEYNNNRGDANDLFDSSTPALTDTSSPNSKLFNGASSGVALSSISASGATMTAALGDGTAIINVVPLMTDPLGSGSVKSSDTNIDCGFLCQWAYTAGASVQLTAVPGTGSSFSGWAGTYCSGTGLTCNFSANQNTGETAFFSCATGNVRYGPLGGPYTYGSAIGTAYGSASSGDYIECHGIIPLTETLTFNVNKNITLEGAFDCPYTGLTPNTILNGDLTVSNGDVGIDYFTINGKMTVSGNGKVTVIASTIFQ